MQCTSAPPKSCPLPLTIYAEDPVRSWLRSRGQGAKHCQAPPAAPALEALNLCLQPCPRTHEAHNSNSKGPRLSIQDVLYLTVRRIRVEAVPWKIWIRTFEIELSSAHSPWNAAGPQPFSLSFVVLSTRKTMDEPRPRKRNFKALWGFGFRLWAALSWRRREPERLCPIDPLVRLAS